MFHYIYVLQSKKDNKFYTGYTKNLKLRFEQHVFKKQTQILFNRVNEDTLF
jgi:predicted GIY-YIG superfamily endonuclease